MTRSRFSGERFPAFRETCLGPGPFDGLRGRRDLSVFHGIILCPSNSVLPLGTAATPANDHRITTDMLYPTSHGWYRLFTIAQAVNLLRGGGGLRSRRRRPVAVSRGGRYGYGVRLTG